MTEEKEVKITKVLNVSIEKVWDAWTNPQSLQQWLSPEGMTNPEVTNNLEVGGKYRIVMEGRDMPNPSHNGTVVVGGNYIEIEKPYKLQFTWLWEGSPEKTHTTNILILLKKLTKDKTEITLVHSGFADDNMQKEHNMGWISTFRKLEKFLSN